MASKASDQITAHLKTITDWRGKLLGRVRKIVADADPRLSEEWKWNTPVWTLNGNVLAAGAFGDHIKINFFKGASLDDPKGLFNAGLDAKATRAIDLYKDDALNESSLKDLIRGACALNATGSKSVASRRRSTAR